MTPLRIHLSLVAGINSSDLNSLRESLLPASLEMVIELHPNRHLPHKIQRLSADDAVRGVMASWCPDQVDVACDRFLGQAHIVCLAESEGMGVSSVYIGIMA